MERGSMKRLPDGREIYYAGKGTAVILAAFSALFVGLGLFVAQLPGEDPTVGLVVVGVFGLCFIVSILMLTTRSIRLELDEQGFTAYSLLNKSSYSWKDVQNFDYSYHRGSPIISFDLRKHDGTETGVGAKVGRAATKLVTGGEKAISGIYGPGAEDMVVILKQWHEQYGNPE